MKIRLVNPVVSSTARFHTAESRNIPQRIGLLINILSSSVKDGIDLVVTSHNFFYFECDRCQLQTKDDFIVNCLLPLLNSINFPKIPLVLGFDLNNGIKNPYDGINGIVGYFEPNRSTYVHKTSIWESWSDKGQCDERAFKEQNRFRTFLLQEKKFGLLSCGDTLKKCYGDFNSPNIPGVDVYLNPSHTPPRGHASQQKNPPKLIASGKCKYSFGTRQLQAEPKPGALVFGKVQPIECWRRFGQHKAYVVDVDI